MLLRSQGLLKTHNLPFSNYMLLCHRNSIGRLKFNSHWNVLCTLGRFCPGCFLNLTYTSQTSTGTLPISFQSLLKCHCLNDTVVKTQSIPSQLTSFSMALSIISLSYVIYLMSFSPQLECKLHQRKARCVRYMQQMPHTCGTNNQILTYHPNVFLH